MQNQKTLLLAAAFLLLAFALTSAAQTYVAVPIEVRPVGVPSTLPTACNNLINAAWADECLLGLAGARYRQLAQRALNVKAQIGTPAIQAERERLRPII